MFVLNSRLDLSCATIFRWSSLSLSYGCILPSSLTRVFSLTLGFSPSLPVSVLVRAHPLSALTFPGSNSLTFAPSEEGTPHRLHLDALFQTRASTLRCVINSSNERTWYRNIRRLSVAFASPLRLRSRLTPGRRALPGKPQAFGFSDSH